MFYDTPNPFLIETQKKGEDRLTYAFSTIIKSGGAKCLGSLLRHLHQEIPDLEGPVQVTIQPSTLSARPDAQYKVPSKLVVLFENKIGASLGREQLKRHLGLFGSVPSNMVRILLVITPDKNPPPWWKEFVEFSRDGHQATAVYGAWGEVARWVELYAKVKEISDETRLLLNYFLDYLQRMGLVSTLSTEFDPDVVALLSGGGAAKWQKAFVQQHCAQEAFLKEAYDEFSKWATAEGLNKCIEKDPVAGSRWAEAKWVIRKFPAINSFLQFHWTTKIPSWESLQLWTAIHLTEESEFKVLVGILLEGTTLVEKWYGKACDVAEDIFGERLSCSTWGMGYGDLFAISPFTLDNQEGMRKQIVEDLKKWVIKFPELLAKKSSVPVATSATSDPVTDSATMASRPMGVPGVYDANSTLCN